MKRIALCFFAALPLFAQAVKMNTVSEVYKGTSEQVSPQIFTRGNEVYKRIPGGAEALTSDGNAKSDLKLTEGKTAATWLQDGIRWRIGLNGKGLRPVYAPADLNHILVYGQSRAVGRDDHGSPSVTTSQPFNNVSLDTSGPLREYYSSDGEWAYREWANTSSNGRNMISPADKSDAVGDVRAPVKNHEYFQTVLDALDGFSPLFEGGFSPVGHGGSYPAPESFTSATCNALTWRTGKRFVGTVAGIGSTDPYELTAGDTQTSFMGVDLSGISGVDGYGTGPFADALYQIKTAKRLADAQGFSYKCAAIIYHETYTQKEGPREVGEICNEFNRHIKGITGQVEDVVFVVKSTYGGNQVQRRGDDCNALSMHTNTDTVQDGEFVDNGGRVYVAFPTFAFTNEATHYLPHETRAMSEKYAQVIEQVVFRSEEWEPVRIKRAWNVGTDVFVQFYTQGQIRSVPPPSGGDNNDDDDPQSNTFGMGVWSQNVAGTKRSRSAEIIGFDLVKISCSHSVPSGSVRVGREYLYYSSIVGEALGTRTETFNKDASGNSYTVLDYLVGGHQPID